MPGSDLSVEAHGLAIPDAGEAHAAGNEGSRCDCESGSSIIGLAFLLNTPTEVDATYESWLAAGNPGHKPPWDAFWASAGR